MANAMSDILVADDNPQLLSVLTDIFREWGYEVRTASDGFEALSLIRERLPDILVSDLNMPRMSGFELLSIVRRRFPTIAVIAMSGCYDGCAIPEGVAADAYYAKGSTSVAGIFDIFCSIKDDLTRDTHRVPVPVWLPDTPLHHNDQTSQGISCPECMRVFAHSVRDVKSSRVERCCPFCYHAVQVAIAGQCSGVDMTGANYHWVS